MMLVIILKRAPIRPSPRAHFRSSELIEVDQSAPNLSFVISYEAHPSDAGFSFNVYCRQLQWVEGEGVGIPSKPLIDMVMPDILKGSAMDHVIGFILKLIDVECNLSYVYASHTSMQECFIDLFKWASLFTNYSRLVSIREQQMDDILDVRKAQPKWYGMCGDPLFEIQIENSKLSPLRQVCQGVLALIGEPGFSPQVPTNGGNALVALQSDWGVE